MDKKQGQRFDVILLGIVLLAAFLNIFNIWQDRYANAYYTSAVTSMLQSWHNFFYASFDPAGYVTVDKPPVVFWVQTLFAYIFGVHGWSVILPQALAGVGSVLLIYRLVKPTFGLMAARLASLVMACSPIAVAVSRTNNIDSMLVFALLLATWMLFRGIGQRKAGWILAAFAMIGVGFNMKMMQAYMVAPAFYVFYILAFKIQWKKKLTVLAAATVLMVGVSLSWAVIVDAIPQDSRPYIGSSQTNSVLELACGYNGMSRLTGMNRGGGNGAPPSQEQGQPQMQANTNNMPQGFNPQGDGQQGDRPNFRNDGSRQRGGGFFGTGQPGPLRLFQSELSGQISWLLPFVALASVGLLAGMRRKQSLTSKQNETLFWLAWLLPGRAFFSVAGFFHQYYLIMLAPPIAALVGAGWVELWQQYKTKADWKRWLLPAGILTTTAFELYILQPYQSEIGLGWSIGIGVAGIGLTLVLCLATQKQRLAALAAVAGMLVLLVAPLYWATTPILYGGNSMIPQAGPSQQVGPNQFARANHSVGPNQSGADQKQDFNQERDANQKRGMGGGPNSEINTKLLAYLTKHNTGETYLFATTDSNTAAPYIIQTGKAVMAMGGFSGSDPILTVDKLKEMVANKEVKYFLISSGGGFGGPDRGGSSEVLNWIRANSTEVPTSEWQASNTQQGEPMGMRNDRTLYEIKDMSNSQY